MLMPIDPMWPLGIEDRWISSSLWQKLERVYSTGMLGSDPKIDAHVAATLSERDRSTFIEAVPWDEVKAKSNLSAILAHDVIDHLPDFESVCAFLGECFHALKQEGQMYMMCHPGKSRVGTNLFDYNRAYLHLLTKATGIHTLMIDDPVESYRKIIKKSGFKVSSERVYTEYIERYFDAYKLHSDCEVQFVEYVMYK